MKKTCKKLDIADQKFILRSIQNYFSHKSISKIDRRPDIQRIMAQFKNNAEMAAWFSKNINAAYAANDRNLLGMYPVRIDSRPDRSNGKIRNIVIENVVNQIYNQIVFDGLHEAARCVGEYQCTCLKNQPKYIYHRDGTVNMKIVGRGQEWAVNVMYEWWQDPDMRACVSADIKKNYDTIPQDGLSDYLEHHVDNDKLLWLNRQTWPMKQGLYIGSVSSIINDAIYLSQIYHYMSESAELISSPRRGKSHRLVAHIMMWMDNIYLMCRSVKDAKQAANALTQYAESIGVHIKPDWYIVTKKDPPKSPKIHQAKQSYIDIVGYRVYPDHITMRNRDYVKARRAFKKKNMNLHDAYRIVSYNGFVKTSNCYRFRKKYHVKNKTKAARRMISNES